jgi:hypothetical protein
VSIIRMGEKTFGTMERVFLDRQSLDAWTQAPPSLRTKTMYRYQLRPAVAKSWGRRAPIWRAGAEERGRARLKAGAG